MELSYKVPDHLVPYLEFIPEEQLCEMISIALEKAINKRSLEVEEGPKQEIPDYTYLLNEITKRFQTAQIVIPTAATQEDTSFETRTYNFEVVAETSSDTIDSDDDLDADFLADIMK